jgi:hypothetical protein
VGLGLSVWCIHCKHGECACSQAHPCVCASDKGKPVARRGCKAYGPPSWEVAGLSNSSGGDTMLRPQRGEGADATSHQAQLYENSLSLIFWPV